MPQPKTVILGGGMTGLAAGYASGLPIYEASERPGGICSSYYSRPGDSTSYAQPPADGEAYRFELGGGHWIFGGDPHRTGPDRTISTGQTIPTAIVRLFSRIRGLCPIPTPKPLTVPRSTASDAGTCGNTRRHRFIDRHNGSMAANAFWQNALRSLLLGPQHRSRERVSLPHRPLDLPREHTQSIPPCRVLQQCPRFVPTEVAPPSGSVCQYLCRTRLSRRSEAIRGRSGAILCRGRA